jgi:hypothetical protein
MRTPHPVGSEADYQASTTPRAFRHFLDFPQTLRNDAAHRHPQTQRCVTMAEIIGVVAGLVSLSIQIIDTTKKLKARFAAIKGLPETIDKVERNLEFLGFFLDRVEKQNSHPAGAASTDYELPLKHCLVDYSAIRDGLGRLERKLEKMRSKGAFWGLQVRTSGVVVTEIQGLVQMELRAHQHITL